MEEKKAYKHLVYAIKAITRKIEAEEKGVIATVQQRVLASLVADIQSIVGILDEVFPGLSGGDADGPSDDTGDDDDDPNEKLDF